MKPNLRFGIDLGSVCRPHILGNPWETSIGDLMDDQPDEKADSIMSVTRFVDGAGIIISLKKKYGTRSNPEMNSDSDSNDHDKPEID